MRQQLFVLLAIMPFMIHAQTANTVQNNNEKIVPSAKNGIHWINGLSWKEIVKKARKENRYIFFDCFTTWCGPCKRMDKEVFSDENVGKTMNQDFINVKLQMDETKTDGDAVKKMYSFTKQVTNDYGIGSYPTYLFFSPHGELVYRKTGYQKQRDFIKTANNVLSGKTSGYPVYYKMVAEYRKGLIPKTALPALIDTAKLLSHWEVLEYLTQEYRSYILSQPVLSWFEPKTILFIAANIHNTSESFFQFFFENGRKIDSLTEDPGFAQFVLSRAIQTEINSKLKIHDSGMQIAGGTPEAQPDPDWYSLVKDVSLKYGKELGRRALLTAQVKWYEQQNDWGLCAKYFTQLAAEFPIGSCHQDVPTSLFINMIAWNAIFKRSADQDQIDAAVKIMKQVVDSAISKGTPPMVYMDTYANLLYKAGKIQEAIAQQETALQEAIKYNNPPESYSENLEKMKKGEPTWPHYVKANDIF